MEEQPLAPVTVTLYVVLDGTTTTDCVVSPVLHKNSTASEEATNIVESS